MVALIGSFIDGEHCTEQSSQTQTILNPATGKPVVQVCYANTNTVNQAVKAAHTAFPQWSNTPVAKRAEIMFRFQHLLQTQADELAQLITNEHGKTLTDAHASIERGLAVVKFACDVPNHLKGEFSAEVGGGVDCYSLRQPLGVCVGITPFNFPAMIPLWMFPLAITCGNTFVLKPSERDPSCPLRMAQLLHEAGLPKGVLNVINGDKTAVDALITHADVKAVSFVGSTTTAEHIYHTANKHNKRVQAFGGAKNHALVLADANLEYTAKAVVNAAYGSAGERCMAISVVVAVGDEVANKLVALMKPKIEALKIGIGTDATVEMGPLVTVEHLAKVKSYVDLGLAEGAKLLVDGRKCQIKGYEQGNFMGGCLFDHVKPSMRIYKEEIFGPVLSVVRVPDFETGLQLINAHEYGNGTAVFTNNAELARQFAKRVQVGMVGINVPIPVPVAQHSFGGWKRSFFGDTQLFAHEGVQFYTKHKTITSRW